MNYQKRALFLDRDGVINEDIPYLHQREKLIYKSGIFELVGSANKLEYKVLIVTNQAGIGRGFFRMTDFIEFMHQMIIDFRRHNCVIDDLFFSPFHPEKGVGSYLYDSPLRKPNPGMLVTAAELYDLDLKNSVLIGNNDSDINAGIAAGVGTNIFLSDVLHEKQMLPGVTLVRSLSEIELEK